MQISKTTLAILLFLSLGLNLFFGGLTLGRAWDRPHGGPWAQREKILRQQLPEQDRAVLKAAILENRPAFDALKRELDDARALVQSAQQSGNADALKEALKVEQEKKAAVLGLMRKTRARVMQELSPEGRAAMERISRDAALRFEQRRERMMADILSDLGGPDDPDFRPDFSQETPPQP